MIVRIVDIGGHIVDDHYLNFLFIKVNQFKF